MGGRKWGLVSCGLCVLFSRRSARFAPDVAAVFVVMNQSFLLAVPSSLSCTLLILIPSPLPLSSFYVVARFSPGTFSWKVEDCKPPTLISARPSDTWRAGINLVTFALDLARFSLSCHLISLLYLICMKLNRDEGTKTQRRELKIVFNNATKHLYIINVMLLCFCSFLSIFCCDSKRDL